MFISEAIPNPVGKDIEGEFIELCNDSEIEVSLTGWSLEDASGKVYTFKSQTVPPRGFLVVSYAQSKLSLNNNGEEIILKNAGGERIDAIAWTRAIPEGVALIKQSASSLAQQTSALTPGSPNQIIQPAATPLKSGEAQWYVPRAQPTIIASARSSQQQAQTASVVEGNVWWGAGLTALGSSVVITLLFWYSYKKIITKD